MKRSAVEMGVVNTSPVSARHASDCLKGPIILLSQRLTIQLYFLSQNFSTAQLYDADGTRIRGAMLAAPCVSCTTYCWPSPSARTMMPSRPAIRCSSTFRLTPTAAEVPAENNLPAVRAQGYAHARLHPCCLLRPPIHSGVQRLTLVCSLSTTAESLGMWNSNSIALWNKCGGGGDRAKLRRVSFTATPCSELTIFEQC